MRNPNSYGSVIKLSGKRRRPYAVRITVGWTDDGKQKFKYIGYHETKKAATIALAEFNRNPYDIDAARITFEEIYEKWSSVEFRTLSDSSIKSYRSAYKHCSPLYGKVFRELRKTHLQGVTDRIEAPSMKEMTKFLFLKLYKFGMENDIVDKDYAKFVKLPKKEKAKEKIPFTAEEIEKIWQHVDDVKWADFALILLYTGMRIGELLDIRKEDIHLEERYMVGGHKTDAGIERFIPIHERIVPLIERYMNTSSCEWLIVNNRGTQMQYSPFMKYHWKGLMNNLKMDHRPHDTRHTFISEMDRIGVNQVILKRIVGHANTNVTQVYTHKTIPELVEAVNKVVYCV